MTALPQPLKPNPSPGTLLAGQPDRFACRWSLTSSEDLCSSPPRCVAAHTGASGRLAAVDSDARSRKWISRTRDLIGR